MQQPKDFEERLRAYETAGKGTGALGQRAGRLGNWPVYAAAAGAALAHSTAASAAIIYSGPQNVSATITTLHTHTTSGGRRMGKGMATALVNIDAMGNDFKIGVARSFVTPGRTGYFLDFLSGNGGARLMQQDFVGPARLASGREDLQPRSV